MTLQSGKAVLQKDRWCDWTCFYKNCPEEAGRLACLENNKWMKQVFSVNSREKKVSGTAQPTYMWMKKEKYRTQQEKKKGSNLQQTGAEVRVTSWWDVLVCDPERATSQKTSSWSRDWKLSKTTARRIVKWWWWWERLRSAPSRFLLISLDICVKCLTFNNIWHPTRVNMFQLQPHNNAAADIRE